MPFNEIQFDEGYLARPLPQANSLTRQLLEEQCESQKVETLGPAGYVQKIQEVIRNSDEIIPNLEGIAKQFHTTSRTIRRKLNAEGYNFQQLLNEELSRSAIHYLETTTLTVEQISQQLGYSETASFIHAFKRWTGKVPKAYRR
jgi:AraC-like DNA-binding protein